ncbi:hypothetical protein C2S51_005953 [Perilla frutescens var. frutescens]|nr:hypothetical protein C2S51_005953 [Perilla frutescens var. frutescens]
MDGYSSKRGVATSRAPRKGHNVGSRDTNSAHDQNVQFCNRIGCNGRIKYGNQNMKAGSSEKDKSSKSSFCSSNGNGVIETSSRSGSVMTKEKSSYLDSKRKLSSQLGFDQSESSQSGVSESTQSMSPGRSPTTHRSGSTNKSGQNPAAKTGNVPSSVRSRKNIQYMSGSDKQNTQTASAVSAISKSSGLGTLSSNNRNKCLKNLKCNSISDAVAPSCSSSGSKSPSKNVMKKRSLEGDSSMSGRGRQTTAASTFGGHVSSSSGGASISDTRRNNCTSGSDTSVSASVRTGGSANVNKSRMRLSYRQNGRTTSCFRESSIRVSQFPDSEPPRNVGRPRLSQQYSANASSSSSSSFSLSSSNDDSRSTLMPYTSAEPGYSHLANRGTLQRYNMDGIAEVLLALERIEQDEEMTHEQILALETSLFLSGLNLYDQHREMRLDIDDMSYEELLALGERMGTVSTALSEEELLKCVKRSIYQVTPPELGSTESGEDGDDVKCSVCQEEYVTGDEIGELVECEHAYHVACVSQWLRLKNWCPICKTAASSSSS